MTLPPLALFALAAPVLLAGELLVARIRWLGRLNIPPSIVGGLLVAVALLVVQKVDAGAITIVGKTDSRVWLWPILPRWDFFAPASDSVHQPLLIIFFTCIGLNASWSLARQGGGPLLGFLALATGLAVLQYVVGIITAFAVGADPLMGIICSGVSMVGGFGTAASWSKAFESAGLHNATTIGIAAAALGVVAGGLMAGPLAGRLVVQKIHAQRVANPDAAEAALPEVPIDEGGFFDDLRNMALVPGKTLFHLAVLLLCLKIGAFLSAALGGISIGEQKLTFPVYMGSLIVAAVIRNVHDALGGRLFDTKHIDLIASFSLAWMLAIVMIGLQLGQLANLAAPMLAIIAIQVLLTACIAYWLVFRLMGRDYDAAVMTSGIVALGLARRATRWHRCASWLAASDLRRGRFSSSRSWAGF